MQSVKYIDGWLKCDNLKGFLVALSEIVGYPFDSSDWDAFEAGLEPVADGGEWFTYVLAGETTLEVSVSRIAEEGEVDIRLGVSENHPCLQGNVRVAWMIFNRFDVSSDVQMID